jgi:cytidine deaminase
VLTAKDRALVAAATDVIRRMVRPGWQHVGAALRTAGGRVYTAVNLDTYVGRCALCAEAAALGKAYSEGERRFDTVVAVRWIGRGEPHVVSPCGICREMLADYGDPWVIHPARGRLRRTRASALLPSRYERRGDARANGLARRPTGRGHAR